jgi:DNA adenine methylase
MFDLKQNSTFIDLFAGSGIVSVNVRNTAGCNVILNDYDNIFPLTLEYVEKNLTSYMGLGKNKTRLALDYYQTRLRNGLVAKVTQYNQILKSCTILHKNYSQVQIPPNSVVYVDPPYYGIKGLYQHTLDHQLLHDYLKGLDSSIKVVISYNDCEFIRNLYRGWYTSKVDYQYSCGTCKRHGGRQKTELIISNQPILNKSTAQECVTMQQSAQKRVDDAL